MPRYLLGVVRAVSCWPYYLAWFVFAQLFPALVLLGGLLVLLAAQPYLPDPWVWLRTAGRLRKLRVAVEADGCNVAARCSLARIYLERGQPQQALAWLFDAQKRSPKQPELLLLTGRAHLAAGEPEAALQASLKALDSDARAGYGEPYRLAGDALCQLGRYEEAEDAYEHFLDHNSSSLEAWFKIHGLRRREGRRAEARDALYHLFSTWRRLSGYHQRKQQWSWWLRALPFRLIA